MTFFLNLNTKGEVLQHVLVSHFHTRFGDWRFRYHKSGAVYLLYSKSSFMKQTDLVHKFNLMASTEGEDIQCITSYIWSIPHL